MKLINLKLFLAGTCLAFCLAFTSCKSGTSDADIQTAFNEKAQTDARLTNVSATVNDGVLTLNGQCPDEACRTSAEQAAKDVKGVKSVVNSITVMPAAPVEVNTDAALADGLRDATKDYPGVTATAVNGEVTLTGTIERNKLADLMQTVNSLNPKKVNNNLIIK